MSRIVRTGDGARVVAGGIQGPQGIPGPSNITAATATNLTGYFKGVGGLVTAVTTIPAADLDSHVVLDNRGETINTANQPFNIITGNAGLSLTANGGSELYLLYGGEVRLASSVYIDGQGGGALFVNDAAGTSLVSVYGYNGSITAGSFFTENGYGFADNADAYFYSIVGEDLGTGDYLYSSSGRLSVGSWSSVGLNSLSNDAGFITSAALSGYATESYVNASVSGLWPQSTGEAYVNSSLTPYWQTATGEAYVNSAVSGLASTGYVDGAASGALSSANSYTDSAIAGLSFLSSITLATPTDLNGMLFGNGATIDSDPKIYSDGGDSGNLFATTLNLGNAADLNPGAMNFLNSSGSTTLTANGDSGMVVGGNGTDGVISLQNSTAVETVYLSAATGVSANSVTVGNINAGTGALVVSGDGSMTPPTFTVLSANNVDVTFSITNGGDIKSNQIAGGTADTASTPAVLLVFDAAGVPWYFQGWSTLL